MRVILVISVVLAVAQARPDASHLQPTYPQEKQPDGYQGVTPDHSAAGVSAQQYNTGSSSSSSSFGTSAGSSGFGVSGGGVSASFGSSGSGNSGAQRNVISGFQSQQDYNHGSSVASFPALQQSSGGASFGSASAGAVNSAFAGSSSSASQGASRYQGSAAAAYADAQQLEPIITKSFYFEAAPEEPEEAQAPRFVPIGRPQKNYKIIFIKTPAFGLNSQVIPIVPPNEEKTIVYVLSKKPEFNQDIELPTAPVTEATKPEVFFIKYKNEQEAQDAQSQIQGAYQTSSNIDSDANINTIAQNFIRAGNLASTTFNSNSYSSGASGSAGIRSGSVGTTAGVTSSGSNSATYTSGSSAANYGATTGSAANYVASTGSAGHSSSGGSSYSTASRFGGEADAGAANIVIGSEQVENGLTIRINPQEGGEHVTAGTEYSQSSQGSNDGSVSVNFVDVSAGHLAGAGHH